MCTVEGPPLKKPKLKMLTDDQPIPIYLDHNATTPICDEAWEAMLECRHAAWGNPSSLHPFGLEAKLFVEDSRMKCSIAIGATAPNEIYFTSGGTEANNMAVLGGALKQRELDPKRKVVMSTAYEHPAIEEVLVQLEKLGFDVHRCPIVASTGVIDVAAFKKIVEQVGTASIAIITIMHANNELGSINPISELTTFVRQQPGGDAVVFHTDAAQTIGKIPVNVKDLGVDLLSICSHKFYGPKGIGALYKRTGIELARTTHGAGHESGVRPGTENVVLIKGMAAALKKACENQPQAAAHAKECRDALLKTFQKCFKVQKFEMRFNGSLEHALPNTLNFSAFHKPTGLYASAARLITELGPKVCMSAGSACHSSVDEEVVVSLPLKAVGADEDRAVGTLRLTTGQLSKLSEMPRAAQIIARACANQMPEY